MLALIFAPFAVMWTVETSDFIAKVTDAEWDYVGYRERHPGPAEDGSQALTLEVDGTSFILFKQRAKTAPTDLAANGD